MTEEAPQDDVGNLSVEKFNDMRGKLKLLKHAFRELKTNHDQTVQELEAMRQENMFLKSKLAESSPEYAKSLAASDKGVSGDSELLAQQLKEKGNIAKVESVVEGAAEPPFPVDVEALRAELQKAQSTIALVNQDRAALYDEIARLRASEHERGLKVVPDETPETSQTSNTTPRSTNSDTQEYVEVVFENQRYIPFLGWKKPTIPTDRDPWTDEKNRNVGSLDSIALPSSWRWSTDWRVDMSREVDKEGWEYSNMWGMFGWHNHNQAINSTRRRRWIRKRTATKN